MWLHRHRPDALAVEGEDLKLQWIFEQDNLVESYARRLFPEGRLVQWHSEASVIQEGG